MTMAEDPEVLNIADAISGLGIIDDEHSRNLGNEAVNIHGSEYSENLLNETSNQRDENSNNKQKSDNSEEVFGPDQDQDQAHPAYIPRTGQFFMHDTRETGEKAMRCPLSRADCKWRHDLYIETDQTPMSDQEFARKYGMDRKGNRVFTLQEMFSALRRSAYEMNQGRIRTATHVWNASRHFTREHRAHNSGTNSQDRKKGMNMRKNRNSLQVAVNVFSENNCNNLENEKPKEGKEAERSEMYNTNHNAELKQRHLGKRYSTQRPMKSVEM